MTTKLLNLVILGLFFISNPFYGQELKGKILDIETLEPLENVNILNKRTGYGSTSNLEGTFQLNRNIRESDSLIFSYIGYQTATRTIAEFKSASYQILLKKKVDNLGLVDISAKTLKDEIEFQNLPDIPKALYAFSMNIVNGELFIIAGSEFEETKQALKLLDRYSDLSLNDYLSALTKNPNNDWAYYNSNIYRYHFADKDWETMKNSIIPRAYHNSEVINDKIYIFGGKTLSTNHRQEYLPNQVEIYDVKNDTVLVDETNPHMAVNFSSFANDSLIFVMGGSIKEFENTQRKHYSNKVHVFNPKNGFWNELGNMPEGKETSGILVNDRFYFIGGYKAEAVTSIETYNYLNGKWQRIGKLFEPMTRPAIAKKDDIIYIFEKNRMLSFNTLTRDLKEYKIGIDLYEAKMLSFENDLYIVGGYRKSQFKLIPSKDFYKVPLENLRDTKVEKQRTLDSF